MRIHKLIDVQNKILRERADRAKGGRSQEFIAFVNGNESALLSYEDWREQSLGFIYEIFVLPFYRKRCIGTALLSYAEDLALKFGCNSIRLNPYSLDLDTDQEQLVSWYARKGYIHSADETDVLEKYFVKT